jgi:DNA-binding PadR family transcriptional regulator
MKDDPSVYLPLSPATLHILLALAGEDLHGYGIMQEVSRQSEGRYKLGPGTLYDNIQRLTSQGLVQEVARRTAAERAGNDDSRRRYYRLTSSGRSVLSKEISRLETVVRDGKLRMQSAKPRRA